MLEWLFAGRAKRWIFRIIPCFLRPLPANTVFERLFEELVDQLGHGQLFMLGLVVESGHNEKPNFGDIMMRSWHGDFVCCD